MLQHRWTIELPNPQRKKENTFHKISSAVNYSVNQYSKLVGNSRVSLSTPLDGFFSCQTLAPVLPPCVLFHSLFTPRSFCTCPFLFTVWLLNPPECMDDSFDIRRKDRLLRRGPVSLEPGDNRITTTILCCWQFFLLLVFFSPPHLFRVETLPFGSHIKHCLVHKNTHSQQKSFERAKPNRW